MMPRALRLARPRRKHWMAGLPSISALLLLLLLAGCSGVSSGPTSNSSATITVVVTPTDINIASSSTQQFTAIVNDASNNGVTWTASAGTISASGLYQAPAVTTNTTAIITATSTADTTRAGTAIATIIPPGVQPLSITTTSLASATSGSAYSDTFAATGGTLPYTWTLTSGTLPPGITLQTSGALGGTPTQSGQFSFTAQVADSSSSQQTATQSFTLTVASSGGSGGSGGGGGGGGSGGGGSGGGGGTTGTPTIPETFFGADFNVGTTWPPTDGLNQGAVLSGLRLWDDNVKWSDINTADGVYDFTNLDSWLGKAESANMDVLYTFGATPQFAAPTTPPAGCLSPGPYSCAPPTDVNADGTGTDAYFSAFVTALVTHAAGRISFYELWNEADSPGFWGGTEAQMVRMGQDAAAIIRSLDPNAQILSPSAHGNTMSTWFDGYIAAGGAPNFDIVNVHMRGGNQTNASPETFLSMYGLVETELTARNLTSLPLWDDEHGILDGQGLTDPDELAGYVARSAILRAGVGLQRQYVYQWDSPAPYGLQGNLSGTAWDQVAGWLIGHSISPCTANGTVYSCQVDDGLIVWDTAQSCSNGVCTTSTFAYPATYSWYYDIAGNRTALSGGNAAIGYKPIFLSTQ